MKRFLLILLCNISFFTNAHDCQIKPVLKEYPAPKNLNKYPLENKIAHDLVIFTPIPRAIVPNIVHYLYDKEKRSLINFSSNTDEGYRMVLDSAFGLKEINTGDEKVTSFINMLKNKNAQIVEIDLKTKNYKVFAVIISPDLNVGTNI